MKTKKAPVIIAVILIAVGLIISFTAATFSDFQMDDLDSLTYTTNKYDKLDKFDSIKIDSNSFNIHVIATTEVSRPEVICEESEELYNEVTVNNSTLYIDQIDERDAFSHIMNVQFRELKIDIYLPIYSEYKIISANSSSGNIAVTSNLTFDEADIKTASGSVTCDAYVKNNVNIDTTSGNIYMTDTKSMNIDTSTTSGEILLYSVQAYERLDAQCTSGDITITDSAASFSNLSTTSGDIDLTDYTLKNDIRIECTSGDISLNDCDAENLEIGTTSGDVTGTLLSEKIYYTSTNSGDVDIPLSGNGGLCKIVTTSGDISISVK